MSAVLVARLALLTLLLAACSPEMRAGRPAEPREGRSRVSTGSPSVMKSAERRGIGVRRGFSADGSKIDWSRSLAVTEIAVLSRFTFQEVLETLACPAPRACATGTADERKREALALFQQWWSTQNGAPHQARCTEPRLFGFPYCPRAEQALAGDDPFAAAAPSGYLPIGLFNRIDLASEDDTDCGEYRIVFARRSGQTQPQRLLINFEAALPNPEPARGLAGCKPVAEFWQGLAAVDDPATRGEKLWKFYFGRGEVPGFAPVIHADNYSAANGTVGGQIRTNQFMQGPWVLREFWLVRTCPACRPELVPARLPQTPFGPLFGNASAVGAHPLTRPFQDWFVTQLATITEGGLHTFNYALPAQFTTGQSVSCLGAPDPCENPDVEGNYRHYFANSDFRIRIAGSTTMHPDQVIARATALSCAGCHELAKNLPLGGDLVWPQSRGFVHVSEIDPENGAYRLSPALVGNGEPERAMLAHRAGKLQAILDLP